MSDVDDELLALVGNGSSSSRAASPAAPSRRRKRRRGNRADEDDDDDDEDEEELSDEDAEGSDDDDGLEADEPVNPYRLEGIYENEEDRERLLDLPELEREAELAARRDLIVQRRQKADLRAMVRNQQLAGRKSAKRSSKPKPKKTRRLKKASAAPARRRRRDSDDDESEEEEEQEDSDEEEEEESDYEASRSRSSRSRKPAAGKLSAKAAQLQKLKKSRVKAQRRKQGGADGSDDEGSSGGDSESSYDAEEAEAVWRRKKERERAARGEPKREVKQTREEERRRNGWPWTHPTLSVVNAARVRRDHFTRLIHRPDWMNQLRGKFARINYTTKDRATGHVQTSYRLVQILECREGDGYYEVSDQYTNAVCEMSWGGAEKMRDVPLLFVSNSPVTQQEYDEWRAHVDRMEERKRSRSIPSQEATQDQADELETFISRPFTEQDINEMLARKRKAREAFQSGPQYKQQAQRPSNGGAANGAATNGHKTVAVYDEVIMGKMNEKHRKADRERHMEAERKNALAIKMAAQRLASSKQNTPGTQTPTKATPLGTSLPASPAVKPTIVASNVPGSLAVAAADVDVDLGDF